MKYINIIDLHDFECYSNINCRLLYLELCSLMDVKTRNAVVSIRSMERVLPCSYAAIRHALEQLIKCGLVSHIGTQKGAHGSAHIAAQVATHLHIMSYNELDTASSAPSNAERNAPSNAVKSADRSASINKEKENLNFKNSKITHTHARDLIFSFDKEKMSLYVDISQDNCQYFKDAYIEAMSIKGKTWKDESDLVSHFLDWSVKNKKKILHRADESRATKEPEQEQPREEAWHPSDIPSADWEWICRTVHRGEAAPAVLEIYNKGMQEYQRKS